MSAENSFKETEIGPIPVEWDVVWLGDVLREVNVRVKDMQDIEAKQFPVLSLTKDRGLILQSERFGKRIAKDDVSDYKVVQRGQIVYNPYVIWEGAVHILRDYEYGLVSPVYPVWEAKPHVAHAYFIDHLLRMPLAIAAYNRFASGAVNRRRSIRKRDFAAIQIPLAPLPEQRRIAHILSTIQRAIAAQDNLIVAGKETKRSLMQRLFTYGPGPEPALTKETEIGEIPEHWEVVRVGELCQLDRENIEPQELPEMPYVGLEHIESSEPKLRKWGSSNEVRSSKHHFVPRDVLYGKLRPYLDKAVLAEFEGVCSTDILVVKANAEFTLPEFLVHLLHTQQFLSYAISTTSGTNLPRTRWTSLRDFKLALPPLPEQRRIASILQAADRKIEAEEQRKAALQALFKSMLYQLMTGQVRVPELVEVL